MTQHSLLIVGASRGIGLALAEEWLGRGWPVIATTRGDAPGWITYMHAFPIGMKSNVPISGMRLRSATLARLQGHRLDALFVNAVIAR